VYINNKNSKDFIDYVLAKNPDVVLVMETNKWWQVALQPLRKKYSHYIEYPLEDSYGIMLYSKYELQNQEILFLEHAGVPSIHAKVRLSKERQFYFHGVHPVPPIPTQGYPDNIDKKDDVGELNKVAELVAKEDLPVIVAGDFNDVAWSNTGRVFQKNSRLRDVRVGRGLYNSFNAHSYFMRWPIDHVFVTEDFKLITLERLKKFGSDHFPIYVKLALLL
jgi:endonuclease/exonuclease/phosphatase (EEP) superfamily protein YafD